MSRRWKVVLVVLAVLALIAIVQLIASGGGHDVQASTGYPNPRCTRQHPCTKRQARELQRYARRARDSGDLTLRAPRHRKVKAASTCRSWHPRMKRIARAGEIWWRGAAISWCFNGRRVTSARVATDADVTTLGRFLGFDHITFGDKTEGFYNYGGRPHGGYLLYQRFTFEQCVPVIQIGPFCIDHTGWLKVFGHYDGSGLASGNAP